MNNNTEISVSGKTLKLTFGMMSYFEFANRSIKNEKRNFVQAMVDLLYSGHSNWCAIKEKPVPVYGDIFEFVDELLSSDEGTQKMADIQKFYETTTAGVRLYGAAEEVKKKAKELNVPLPEEIQKDLTLIK